ncbi:MAG: hypothetical protein EWV58_15180 [Microcystis aeruginosa Ma_MB_F_20061100_S19]|nr:MAG: hypothetical protein EWV59_21075 [Microcystis aeruginosa Ma_MB_F_20061100_S19D]TRU13085.1 MAG: hypothetical protein EWV58_15180 [Microcystis aeruginosa Ma_MB_F_20061100_S19]
MSFVSLWFVSLARPQDCILEYILPTKPKRASDQCDCLLFTVYCSLKKASHLPRIYELAIIRTDIYHGFFGRNRR